MTTAASPTPVTVTEDADDYLLSYLTRKLVGDLQDLKLNNSYVPLIRELGTGYKNLVHLWMARCSIKDLDGIGSMCNLKELYLAYNEISDLSPLASLELLEVLDLEGNETTDPDQLEYLALCPNLSNLTLEGNPLVFELKDEEELPAEYLQDFVRDQILSILPNLKLLDDVFTGAGQIAEKLNPSRPSTSYGTRPLTPISDLPQVRPGRPSSSMASHRIDSSSTLTSGNPISLIRNRRKQATKSAESRNSASGDATQIQRPVSLNPTPPKEQGNYASAGRRKVRQTVSEHQPKLPQSKPVVLFAGRRRSKVEAATNHTLDTPIATEIKS